MKKETTVIFLRHAETEKDPNMHSEKWGLSKIGEKQAKEASKNSIFDDVDVILTSQEDKSYLTALPIAERLQLPITQSSAFNEIGRGSKYLPKEDFAKEKEKQLTDLEYAGFGGEKGKDALARFENETEKVISENKGKTILIVSHGTILNLYFAHLLGITKDVFYRWEHTDFCAIGVVRNHDVVNDIV